MNSQHGSSSNPSADERREFGKRLTAARLAMTDPSTGRPMTQGALAARLGVAHGNIISTYESGKYSPGGRVPWVLERVLGYEVWAGLWGDVEARDLGELRLVSDRDIDARAEEIARRLLAEAIARMGTGSQP